MFVVTSNFLAAPQSERLAGAVNEMKTVLRKREHTRVKASGVRTPAATGEKVRR